MKNRLIALFAISAVTASRVLFADYTPEVASLSRHAAAPEWLKDAKLGIYFHWGVYSVPAYNNEWYPRNMFLEGDKVYDHHRKTYGDAAKFGYQDFIPDFKAEHFDPEEWAELFKNTGARFAGPVAEHHDGFAMWASKATPWNAKDMGPKRDVLGELFKALEKRDMKTIATFHHARNLQRYHDTWEQEWTKSGQQRFVNSHYPYRPGSPTASEDPKLRLLYGNVPEAEWLEKIWWAELKEVIDGYRPDIIWFDSWLDQIPEAYRLNFCAYYLNAAKAWNKEVAIVRKQDDLPLAFSINDHEKSREPAALPHLWMTDDTISRGSWCYTENLKIKELYQVVHTLIDTVSKNGVVLLNISPKADGTIPQDQREVMLGLGKWLGENGEAIYATRPWINAAEGPTSEPGGGFNDREKFLNLKYTAADIRYTASKDQHTVYAILLGTPKAGEKIVLHTFAGKKIEVSAVQRLGGGKVSWAMEQAGLEIFDEGERDPAGVATIYKISLK